MTGPLPTLHDLLIYFFLYLAGHKATFVAFSGLAFVAIASAIPDPHNPEDWGDPSHRCSTGYIFFHKAISNFLGMTGRNRYTALPRSTFVPPPPLPVAVVPANPTQPKQEKTP